MLVTTTTQERKKTWEKNLADLGDQIGGITTAAANRYQQNMRATTSRRQELLHAPCRDLFLALLQNHLKFPSLHPNRHQDRLQHQLTRPRQTALLILPIDEHCYRTLLFYKSKKLTKKRRKKTLNRPNHECQLIPPFQLQATARQTGIVCSKWTQ